MFLTMALADAQGISEVLCTEAPLNLQGTLFLPTSQLESQSWEETDAEKRMSLELFRFL